MSRKLALIIGNSEYEDGNLSRLAAPAADVNALAEVLRDPQIGGFDDVTALANQPANAIRRAISAFFVERGRDDLLLLYFSGHGVRDDRGQLFLAAKDTEHNLLRGTAIPAAFITEEMDNSRSRRQVLVLDCCHSGAFSHGMKAASGGSVGTATAFEGAGSGRVVLTATDSTQYAWEGDQVIGQAENSVFTHYLIQGLRTGEADSDADGQITLDELYNYVYEHVVYETPLQTPGKWSFGQQGEIVIARNPRPVVKPAALAPELQQTIDDPRPWVREGAVQELDRLLKSANPGLALSAYEALQRLANDDSRRVAATAANSLAAYDDAQRAAGKAETPSAPQPGQRQPTEDQRQVIEKAEPGRQAQKKEEPAEQSRTSPNQGRSTPEASVARPEKTGRASQARAAAPELVFASGPTAWILSAGMTIIAWTLSFSIGDVITYYYRSDLIGAIAGFLAGLVTGLALRRVEASIRWKHILLIALGLGVTIGLSWTTNSPIFSAIAASSLGSEPTAAGAVYGVVVGVLGGLIIGLALKWAMPSLPWVQILLITIGWPAGSLIGGLIYAANYSNISTSTDAAVFGAIFGFIPGAIGGGVTFLQLRQARRQMTQG